MARVCALFQQGKILFKVRFFMFFMLNGVKLSCKGGVRNKTSVASDISQLDIVGIM